MHHVQHIDHFKVAEALQAQAAALVHGLYGRFASELVKDLTGIFRSAFNQLGLGYAACVHEIHVRIIYSTMIVHDIGNTLGSIEICNVWSKTILNFEGFPAITGAKFHLTSGILGFLVYVEELVDDLAVVLSAALNIAERTCYLIAFICHHLAQADVIILGQCGIGHLLLDRIEGTGIQKALLAQRGEVYSKLILGVVLQGSVFVLCFKVQTVTVFCHHRCDTGYIIDIGFCLFLRYAHLLCESCSSLRSFGDIITLIEGSQGIQCIRINVCGIAAFTDGNVGICRFRSDITIRSVLRRVHEQLVPLLAHIINDILHFLGSFGLCLSALVRRVDELLKVADPFLEECLDLVQQAGVRLCECLNVSFGDVHQGFTGSIRDDFLNRAVTVHVDALLACSSDSVIDLRVNIKHIAALVGKVSDYEILILTPQASICKLPDVMRQLMTGGMHHGIIRIRFTVAACVYIKRKGESVRIPAAVLGGVLAICICF